MGDIEGIDVDNVSAWMVGNIPGATPPLTFELVAGGRSNLTFLVDDGAGNRFVLRRPPTSHVLPSAHDMGREYRIISALAPTPVPVPPALAFCGDESINGRPFYVMAFVEGHVIRNLEAATTLLDEQARRAAGASLAEVLAAIHAVDVDAVGLGDLGRRDGYIERQLRRWYGQFQESNRHTGRPVPLVDQVHSYLAAHVPQQQGTALVHGDYRLDNTILDGSGRVSAVLDWEICTLGDPLADLGLLSVYWTDPDDEVSALGVAPTTAPGFPTRKEVQDRYAELSGRDLSRLDFYVAFGYWKLACILEGVYARYLGGAMGGDRSGVELFDRQVLQLAEAARDTVERL